MHLGAVYNRSVQPMRTLGWDAVKAKWTVSRRGALKADQLNLLNPDDARVVKEELLLASAHAGKLTECTSLLTRHGLSPDVRTADGHTPLMMAASAGRARMVKHLLSHNANVDQVDDWGQSALWAACSAGLPEIVKILLDAGADPHTQDAQGMSARDIVRKMGHAAVLKLLPPSPTPHVG